VSRLSGPQPARPAFLEILAGQRAQGSPAIEDIRRFGSPITGQILVDPSVASDATALIDEARQSGIELLAVSEDGGGNSLEVLSETAESDSVARLLRFDHLVLHGLDFKLFDPRRIYPNEDRVSFVFLSCSVAPSLDGRLVQANNKEQCRLFNSEALHAVDWYLSSPSIHLRYYLEEWFDFFLAWVKYFFVSDLRYWRYEEMSQYEAIREVMGDFAAKMGDAAAKESIFEHLLERFEVQADEWIQRVGEMA
jgi:hypothetical protein